MKPEVWEAMNRWVNRIYPKHIWAFGKIISTTNEMSQEDAINDMSILARAFVEEHRSELQRAPDEVEQLPSL